MNIINIVKAGIAILASSLLFSCDALEVEPTSVITNNSFWKSEDDVNGAVNGMYVQLRNVAAYNLYILGEARSEILSQGSGGTGGYDIYYLNTLTSTSAGPDWGNFYTLINTTNLILKYAPSIPFKSEAAKNKLLAQAYATRAFTYFAMVRTWGDLIIRTVPTETSNIEVIQKERSPQTEVFKLIKDDLEKAEQLLTDNAFAAGRCHWSKPAVQAVKAEVYLWTGKRQNGGDTDLNTALNALNEVRKADLTLLSDYKTIFSYDNKGNKEIVMAIQSLDLESSGTTYHRLMWAGPQLPANISQESKDIIYPVGDGQGIIIPSELYRKQYAKEDLRKDNTFHEIYTTNAETGEVAFFASLVLKGPGLIKNGNRIFLSDLILYRYSDILLMIAETKNALGQDPSPEINQVRERAYKENFEKFKFVNLSKEKNDEAILKERLLELAFEGKRWWDLIRFGKVFDLVPSLKDRKGQDYLLLYPISNAVLSLEPKVKQNPGWE